MIANINKNFMVMSLNGANFWATQVRRHLYALITQSVGIESNLGKISRRKHFFIIVKWRQTVVNSTGNRKDTFILRLLYFSEYDSAFF